MSNPYAEPDEQSAMRDMSGYQSHEVFSWVATSEGVVQVTVINPENGQIIIKAGIHPDAADQMAEVIQRCAKMARAVQG